MRGPQRQTSIRVHLKAEDLRFMRLLATERKQSLAKYLADIIENSAADARHPVPLRVEPEDVRRRHVERDPRLPVFHHRQDD